MVDGGVRDVGQSRSIGFPIWSRDISPITGKWRCVTVEVNGPVSIAGLAVRPGDLVIADERRTVTMLYSRRYRLEGLTGWLEQRGFAVERTKEVASSAGRPRVAHVLARRKG